MENKLTGEIPSAIRNLTQLTDLDLSGNQLAGEIPPAIGNLTELTSLNLSGNQLSGEIPPEIGHLTRLTDLNLSGNQLSGEIPPAIRNLTRLTDLNLSVNQLTGGIGEIPALKNLNSLNLSKNCIVNYQLQFNQRRGTSRVINGFFEVQQEEDHLKVNIESWRAHYDCQYNLETGKRLDQAVTGHFNFQNLHPKEQTLLLGEMMNYHTHQQAIYFFKNGTSLTVSSGENSPRTFMIEEAENSVVMESLGYIINKLSSSQFESEYGGYFFDLNPSAKKRIKSASSNSY